MKCLCGCNKETNIAKRSDAQKGWVRGRPLRYIRWHKIKPYSINDYEKLKNGCWKWLRVIQPNGYGIKSVKRKHIGAHRYIYEKFNGKIEIGMELDHLCRNRWCVNPSHLEIVSRHENSRRGLSTKLSLSKVIDIRKRLSFGMGGSLLARMFNVTPQTICDIKHGRSWVK